MQLGEGRGPPAANSRVADGDDVAHVRQYGCQCGPRGRGTRHEKAGRRVPPDVRQRLVGLMPPHTSTARRPSRGPHGDIDRVIPQEFRRERQPPYRRCGDVAEESAFGSDRGIGTRPVDVSILGRTPRTEDRVGPRRAPAGIEGADAMERTPKRRVTKASTAHTGAQRVPHVEVWSEFCGEGFSRHAATLSERRGHRHRVRWICGRLCRRLACAGADGDLASPLRWSQSACPRRALRQAKPRRQTQRTFAWPKVPRGCARCDRRARGAQGAATGEARGREARARSARRSAAARGSRGPGPGCRRNRRPTARP